MTDPAGILAQVMRTMGANGVDLAAWGLAWARVAPVIALVPALGLRALPPPARAAVGLMLAATIAPALRPLTHAPGPWPLLLLLEVMRGLPVALAAAIPLWAATMAGGLVDAARGVHDAQPFPTVEGTATPLGILFSLIAAVLFLGTGGPSQVALSLAAPAELPTLVRVASDLAQGIALAVGVAAPLLGASIVIEVTGAVTARAASPAHLHALLAPLRSVALIALTALLFDRMAALLRSVGFGGAS